MICNVRKVISWPQPAAADLSKADFSILWVWSSTQLFMRNLNKLDLHPRCADQDSSLFCKTGFWLGPNYAVNVIDTINTVKRKSCKLQSAFVLLSFAHLSPLLIRPLYKNIAKGTTDPRVEFILQDHSSQFTNLEHITITESQLSINFKISTKHQHLD